MEYGNFLGIRFRVGPPHVGRASYLWKCGDFKKPKKNWRLAFVGWTITANRWGWEGGINECRFSSGGRLNEHLLQFLEPDVEGRADMLLSRLQTLSSVPVLLWLCFVVAKCCYCWQKWVVVQTEILFRFVLTLFSVLSFRLDLSDWFRELCAVHERNHKIY